MAAVFLWLLGAGTLLMCAGAQEAYDLLPVKFKKGVDLALEMRNSRTGGKSHFLLFKSLVRSDIEADDDVTYVYQNFYLKATRCPRGTVDTSNCLFRGNRPEIDCAVCFKTLGDEIQARPKPYVNCINKPSLTEDMKRARISFCNRMGYSSGAGGLANTGEKHFQATLDMY